MKNKILSTIKGILSEMALVCAIMLMGLLFSLIALS